MNPSGLQILWLSVDPVQVDVVDFAYSVVYSEARELYPRMSLALNRFPASQLRGLSGAESDMSAMMA